MDSNLGTKKKSFALYYNGGEIWAEHLDTINNVEDMKKKFDEDLKCIARPSTSSYIAIAVAQSAIDLEFLAYILEHLQQTGKVFRKIVFVGLPSKLKRALRKQTLPIGTAVACIDDFEKAKEWLL